MIPLNEGTVYFKPSQVVGDLPDNRVSIDIQYDNRTYTFVSDEQFSNSANMIMTVDFACYCNL